MIGLAKAAGTRGATKAGKIGLQSLITSPVPESFLDVGVPGGPYIANLGKKSDAYQIGDRRGMSWARQAAYDREPGATRRSFPPLVKVGGTEARDGPWGESPAEMAIAGRGGYVSTHPGGTYLSTTTSTVRKGSGGVAPLHSVRGWEPKRTGGPHPVYGPVSHEWDGGRGHMARYSSPTQKVSSGSSNDFALSASTIFGGMVLGAGLGAGASYMTGGEFGSGAIMGGAMAGAMMVTGRGYSAYKYGQDSANGGWTSKVSDLLHNSDKTNHRRAMIAGGGLLGGMAFGGDRSHKKGFNANRGNSIGR